jgi:hypothetical protein
LAGDSFDDAEGQSSMLQYGALLDMELKISKHSLVKDGGRNLAWLQSIRLNCLLDRNTIGVTPVQQLFIQSSYECPASYEGNSEAHAFFF